MPNEIIHNVFCWFLGDIICALYQVFSFWLTFSSVLTMVLISADRYMAICDPLHYHTRITVRRIQFCVCLSWILSVTYSILMSYENLEQPGRYKSCHGECVIHVTYIKGFVELVVGFLVPITLIIFLYMQVFVVAVSQARAMRSHVMAVRLTQRSVTVTAKKSELKAAKTLGVVVGVFLLCYCPFYCVHLAVQNASVLTVSSGDIVVGLLYFNSCLNPIIYAFFYPWFRKSIKFIITLQILQPGSHEANIM
ncbi:hypothetical protein LDENG_00250140 [Lucifuga dentata]|nr:hypothetical protein LDENG_00250140 [Lucifuga dentata]